MVIKSCSLLVKDTETCVGSSLASYFVLFSLISLVSFYFVFISLISFRFCWFRFVSFRVVSFSLISFRFVFVDFVSFRFVSFLFRFALYRYPYKYNRRIVETEWETIRSTSIYIYPLTPQRFIGVPVPDQESDRSCICLCWCIDVASFHHFDIWFWNCFDNVVIFYFRFIITRT